MCVGTNLWHQLNGTPEVVMSCGSARGKCWGEKRKEISVKLYTLEIALPKAFPQRFGVHRSYGRSGERQF